MLKYLLQMMPYGNSESYEVETERGNLWIQSGIVSIVQLTSGR